MSRRLLVCGVFATSVAGLVGTARADSIFVENPSFEALDLADGDYLRGAPDGWTLLEGRFGVFNPTDATFPDGVPDGVNTAHSNGGTIAQVVGAVLEANTLYTLQVALGNRPETEFPGYMVQLLAGGSLLAEDMSTLAPPGQTFANSLVTFQAADDDPLLGEFLEIRLMSMGIQTNFDDVQLFAAVVPTPGTLALLGVAGLAGCRRRRRR